VKFNVVLFGVNWCKIPKINGVLSIFLFFSLNNGLVCTAFAFIFSWEVITEIIVAYVLTRKPSKLHPIKGGKFFYLKLEGNFFVEIITA
jgi:hypothetical protein